jgi:predicted cupin superfamily sugar epimerase/RimJ/RimL family protein N-acetyltransferase
MVSSSKPAVANDTTTLLPLGPALPAWRARARPDRRTLVGRLCRLEAYDAQRHVQPLFDALADNRGRWTYLPQSEPATPDQLALILEATNAGDAPAYQTYVICEAHSDVVLGMASYMRIDPANGSIEVGFVVYGEALQRSAAATEAQYLMARHIFDDLGYRRYEWKCNALNVASRSAAVRLGFRYEGVFRNAMVAQGHSRDTAWFAVTDDDWRHVKPRLEAWLASDNFDENGRQRQSLTNDMLHLWGEQEAQPIIDALGLRPHPEGGWYGETWRDAPANGGRGVGTAIHYLLRSGERSHWHRVDAAEVWLWHAGAPLALGIAEVGGAATTINLGADLPAGQRPQALVPAGAWQAAQSLGAWSLVSCVVAPAFDFAGFEMAPPGWQPASVE